MAIVPVLIASTGVFPAHLDPACVRGSNCGRRFGKLLLTLGRGDDCGTQMISLLPWPRATWWIPATHTMVLEESLDGGCERRCVR